MLPRGTRAGKRWFFRDVERPTIPQKNARAERLRSLHFHPGGYARRVRKRNIREAEDGRRIAGEDRAEFLNVERMLRTFAATEK